jgi:outer membrane lipoprotein SlyB
MKLRTTLSVLMLAVAAAMPLAAIAQTASAATSLTVDSFAADPVRTLVPGTELSFDLTATPRSEVTVRIIGATGLVRMEEIKPGVYQGAYTVRTRDKVTAASLVTARIVKDGQVVNATMDQSLMRGSPSPVPASRILAFSVNTPEGMRPGDELKFSLAGVPGGTARVKVDGITQVIPLTEVSRGLYEGRYTLSRQDRLRGDLQATGYLVVNRQEASQRFERKLGAAAVNAYGCDRRDGRDNNRPDMVGAECGVVMSVSKVEVDDDSRNVLGTIAGGVLGGVIGNQVGGGSGREIARIVGALGGAYAGNRIQDNRSKTTVYRVAVQLDSGATKNFDHAVDPVLLVGARVKVADGAIVRR